MAVHYADHDGRLPPDKQNWKGCFLKGDMEIVTDMGVKEKFWENKF